MNTQANENLEDWNNIKSEFSNADLLLGNGFAINLHDKFNYISLNKLIESMLTSEHKLMLSKMMIFFKTTNIEYILSNLIDLVNLGKELSIIPDSKLEELRSFYKEVREGLVKAINATNPPYDDLNINALLKVSEEIAEFNNIFTINYDTLLYHIIMLHNDKYNQGHTKYKFSDLFRTYRNRELLFDECEEKDPYKYIYYLHGALFICRNIDYFNHKIVAGEKSKLLGLISHRINSNKLPIFVCEGKHDEKRRYINEDNYLSFCFRKFHKNQTIVIYGMSFGKFDEHIIEIIKKYKNQIAISIYKGNRKDYDIKKEMKDIRIKISSGEKKILFFDSSTLFNVSDVNLLETVSID